MKISIVIPTYNRASLIVRTLDSLYAQTRLPDEVIVVDDGSTDDTKAVVTKYRKPVTYEYQTNARPGAARNNGTRIATGDAILYLDSDDLLAPTALEKMEAALRDHPDAAVAYCAAGYIDGDDKPIDIPEAHEYAEGMVWETLINGNFVRSPGCALVRRSFLDKAGPWLTREEMGVNEDWEIFLRLSELAPFVFVDEPLFLYRVQAGSLGSNELENYHWALKILEIQVERHKNNRKRLALLSKAYARIVEGTEFRWQKAAWGALQSREWQTAWTRFGYVRELAKRAKETTATIRAYQKEILANLRPPTVSVVIPSYNRANYLPATLESIFAQTVAPKEIVVVDDGSTDHTADLMQPLLTTHPTLRYVRRENGGPSATRNTGTENTTGEALVFLDADDLLMPTALEKLSEAIIVDPDAVLAFGRARYINEKGQSVVIPNTALPDEVSDGEMWRHLLNASCIRTPGCVLIRREALDAIGGWDEALRANEDWDLWLRLSEKGEAFERVAEPILQYRVHGDNISGNRELMFQTRLEVYRKQMARHANNPARLAKIKAFYDEWKDKIVETNEPEGSRPKAIVVDAADTVYDVKRHRLLQRIIEFTGIAALYRKTPMEWRIKLRLMFGIDPNA